jgi:hypothetical protein
MATDLEKFDPKKLVKPDGRDDDQYTWFVADTDKVYPAMLQYLEVMRDAPLEDVPEEVRQYAAALQAYECDKRAWRDALGPADNLNNKQRAERRDLLELARLTFTALLRAHNYGPIGIHWTASPQWRL